MKLLRLPNNICRAMVLMSGLSVAAVAPAATFGTLESLNQDQFVRFSENMSAATHYKSIAPPETLGVLGFDIGVEVSSTDVRSELFDLASSGDFDGTELIIPRVHAHKGLPLGIDIGASLGKILDSDATVLGAEVRYAIIDGGSLKPAVGVRATYAQITGVDDFDLKNYALELGISKGVLFFTPYAGIGIVRGTANPNNIDGLKSDSFDQRKIVVGATINLGVALTIEAERTGDFRTYSAKVGVRF